MPFADPLPHARSEFSCLSVFWLYPYGSNSASNAADASVASLTAVLNFIAVCFFAMSSAKVDMLRSVMPFSPTGDLVIRASRHSAGLVMPSCHPLRGFAKVCTKSFGQAVSPMSPPEPMMKTLLPLSDLMVIVDMSCRHFISFLSSVWYVWSIVVFISSFSVLAKAFFMSW